MTLEWTKTDEHRWQAGQHCIIWNTDGYVHIIGARQRHRLPSLSAAKAWAETVEHPDADVAILIVGEEVALVLIAKAIRKRVAVDAQPTEDGCWQLTFPKAGFPFAVGEEG